MACVLKYEPASYEGKQVNQQKGSYSESESENGVLNVCFYRPETG